ncbi:MAG: glutathione S-transferase family protein [Deltaproteobacteria bacterium]|nr:glutathione S-transferase family protein [Deltaproteobacteria bacterium]
MNELILHHYSISPYAEKIRAILGFKKLTWRSVTIPVIMPKPDLTALTGGYRLTPVLQVGADIYCDTKVIARRLEEERPAPTLYPDDFAAITRAVSLWGEALFMSLVTLGLASGAFPREFIEDRRKMVPGGIDEAQARTVMPSRLDHIRATLDLFERQLADGRPFVLGEAASLADFSMYHPLWAMRGNPLSAVFLAPHVRVGRWLDRMAAFGHGTATEMTAADAVRTAREATPTTQPAEDPGDPSGRHVGDRISVFPEAYGRDPVEGEIVRADAHSIAIRRRDERVGEVVVHFPREGTIILAA